MTKHTHPLTLWQWIVRRWQADYEDGYRAGYRDGYNAGWDHRDLED